MIRIEARELFMKLPRSIDVRLRSKEDFEIALWLLGRGVFYCKQTKCRVRVSFLVPGFCTLEVVE